MFPTFASRFGRDGAANTGSTSWGGRKKEGENCLGIGKKFLPLQPASDGSASSSDTLSKGQALKKEVERLLADREKVLTFASASRGKHPRAKGQRGVEKKIEKKIARVIAKREKAFTFAARKRANGSRRHSTRTYGVRYRGQQVF